MKRTLIILFALIVSCAINAQDIVERIAKEICSRIDTIENMDSLYAKVDRCLPSALDFVWNSQPEDDDSDDTFAAPDTVENTVKAVMKSLGYYCPRIREFVLDDMEAKYYKSSGSEKANGYYKAGSDALEAQNYKEAEKQFLKAIKEDPEWVYPLDDIGVTYRKMEDYKKAIKYYEKSLEIYPFGTYALMNEAIAYSNLGDIESAIGNYAKMINLYPDNPEGYYGTARMYYQSNDFEKALGYAFYSHNMYVAAGSEYTKDSEDLLKLLRDKMKEQNKLDIFDSLAAKFGVKISTE
jgi:tetratricopeptide (TPR) repeat protein